MAIGNTGDEVILRTMVAHLRDLRPRLRITVTSATPKETAAAHRVASVLWCDVRAIDATIERSDLVLIGGGGLFFDTCGFDPAAFLTDQHTGIGFYAAPAVLGARLLDLGTLQAPALDDAITHALARTRAELLPREDEVTSSARLARHNAMVAISLLDRGAPHGHLFAVDTTLIPEPFRARLRRGAAPARSCRPR